MTTFATALNQVESLYVGYFGRAGDPQGESYWASQITAGTTTLANIAASFSVQPEAIAKYPYLANPISGDPATFVDQVYQNMFNHTADAAGRAYWVAQLTAAAGNPAAIGSMILNIISGATGVDDSTIKNKVDVAADFTVSAATAGITWNAAAAAQSATEVAATNDTAASVAAQKAATAAFIASAGGLQMNFTLALDTLTANTQNVNFNAQPIFNPGTGTLINSLQTGDSGIDTAPLTGPGLSNGGTFTATLNAAGAIPLITLQGIPTHTVTSITGATGYSGTITGLTTFTNSSSAFGLTIGIAGNGIDKGGVAGTTATGSTLLGTVNINNVTGGATTVIVNAAALAGAADAVAINTVGVLGTGLTLAGANTVSIKNDAAALGVTDNAYETISLNAAAATNIALADATSGVLSTTRVNVAGAGLITLWGQAGAASENHFTKVTTIDATADTGGVTVTGANSGLSAGFLAGNTVFSSFKGGTGADSLDLSGLSAAQVQAISAGNLDGGGGAARDILILANAAATGVVPLGNSNFETIGILGLSGTVDFSKLGTGVDTIALLSAQTGAATFNNLTSGVTIAVGAFNGFNNLSFNAAGSALTDVLNITQTADPFGFANINPTGFETVNHTINGTVATQTFAVTDVASPGATATYNIISNTAGQVDFGPFTVGPSGTVNVSGTGTGGVNWFAALTAGAINASTAASFISIGTAPSGQISILGSNQNDVLLGSAVADSISGGGGNDTIDANAGGDVFAGGSGADTFGGLVAANNFASTGTSVAASASTLTAAVAVGQTITFANNVIGTSNVDRLTDFLSGTDKMNVVTAGVAATSLLGGNATANGTNNTTYVLYGNYAAGTGVFTVAAAYSAATADAIVRVSDGATSFNASTGWVVVTGLNQGLIASDFT